MNNVRPRKLNEQEKETVREAIRRMHKPFTPWAVEAHLDDLLVSYVFQENFTVCILRYKDNIQVGVAKRNTGGWKSRGAFFLNKQEPDDEVPERGMMIALSRAVKAQELPLNYEELPFDPFYKPFRMSVSKFGQG